MIKFEDFFLVKFPDSTKVKLNMNNGNANGYPRYIISLDMFKDQQEGVHHINAIDLFLGKEVI